MEIKSFVEIKLGTVISPSNRIIFTPVQFYPPDLTGNNNLPYTKKLIFREGDSIVLTAPTNYEGKKFINWQVRSNNIVLIESSDNPLIIKVKSNLTVFAIYDGLSITSWPNIIVGVEPVNINPFTITSWPNIIVGAEPVSNSISKINSFVEITLI